MRLLTKVGIDRSLGRILVFCLGPLVRIVGVLLRRDHSIRETNVRCIVVAKYYGLGSIVHAMPMLRALRGRYPGVRLIFVTRRVNKPLFEHIRDVDQVLFVDDATLVVLAFSSMALILKLIQARVDLFFDLELFSAYGALMSLFSLARNRLGFFCSKDTDFKEWIFTHLLYFNFQMPVRVCYLQLARLGGAAAEASPDLVELAISEATRAAARLKLANMVPGGGPQKPGLLAINVNASDLLLVRRWTPEGFASVAEHFARKGYHILFVGSPEERPYVQSVVERLPEVADKIHNVAGAFTLSEFLAVLQECDALLTSDTGTMNFAYALGVPTVSLWGPNNPIRYHIYDGPNWFLYKYVYCSPCIHHLYTPPCRGDNICMQSIASDEVASALDNLLTAARAQGGIEGYPVCKDKGGRPLGVLRDHDDL